MRWILQEHDKHRKHYFYWNGPFWVLSRKNVLYWTTFSCKTLNKSLYFFKSQFLQCGKSDWSFPHYYIISEICGGWAICMREMSAWGGALCAQVCLYSHLIKDWITYRIIRNSSRIPTPPLHRGRHNMIHSTGDGRLCQPSRCTRANRRGERSENRCSQTSMHGFSRGVWAKIWLPFK